MAGPTTTCEATLIVADASVLVELVVDGRHARGADALLTRYAASKETMLVTAPHGLVEAANALRKLVFRSALSAEQAQNAVDELGALDVALDTAPARLARIWALRDRMSAYDAAYAAAAEALRSPLVSVDERLLRACSDAGIAAISLDGLAA